MIRTVPALSMLLVSLAFAAPAAWGAGGSMPKTLVIGYDGEGSVDTSEQACRAFVAQTIQWEKAETDQAVRDVCAAREHHVRAYDGLQKAYGGFRAALLASPRLDGSAAASSAGHLIKSCIDHKWALTTGGHNIRLDIIPNEIAVACLDLGRSLLEKETAELNGAR